MWAVWSSFLLALLFPPPAIAFETPISCGRLFRSFAVGFNKLYTEFHLTDDDRLKILSAIDSSPSPKVAFEKVLDLYVDARVRTFAPEKQEAIRANMMRIWDNLELKPGLRVMDANESGISAPQDLEDAAILMSILGHEMEHRVQQFKMHADPSWIKKARFIINLNFSPLYVWRSEYGAMRAEWELLNALPESFKASSIAPLDRTLPHVETIALKRQLKNSKMSFEDYVEEEFKAGRYDLGSVVASRKKELLFASSVSAYIFYKLKPLPQEILQQVCEGMSSTNPIRETYCDSK